MAHSFAGLRRYFRGKRRGGKAPKAIRQEMGKTPCEKEYGRLDLPQIGKKEPVLSTVLNEWREKAARPKKNA